VIRGLVKQKVSHRKEIAYQNFEFV